MSNEQRNERNANTTNPNTTGAQGMASEPVISVRDLTVSFASEAGTVHAVRGMNFVASRPSSRAAMEESARPRYSSDVPFW